MEVGEEVWGGEAEVRGEVSEEEGGDGVGGVGEGLQERAVGGEDGGGGKGRREGEDVVFGDLFVEGGLSGECRGWDGQSAYVVEFVAVFASGLIDEAGTEAFVSEEATLVFEVVFQLFFKREVENLFADGEERVGFFEESSAVDAGGVVADAGAIGVLAETVFGIQIPRVDFADMIWV